MNNDITYHDDSYLQSRKEKIYLYVSRQICRQFGREPRTVIDVGSNKIPTLEWHRETAQRLVSLDLRMPYEAQGIEAVQANFLEYEPGIVFDLATCFQVLEHVRDAASFAQKLLRISKVTIVSVPYKWKKGATRGHIHDPVDERKVAEWFGKPPFFAYEVRELNGVRRLIHVYHNEPEAEPVQSASGSE